MKTPTQAEFDKKLASNEKFLNGEPGGKALELFDTDISYLMLPREIQKVTFIKVAFPGVMRSITFDQCKFYDCNIDDCPSCSFVGSDLYHVKFNSANAEGTDFSHARLFACGFCGTNLRGACFESAVLTNSNFYDADVMYATFRHANLHGANMWFKRAEPEVWRIVQAAMGLHILQTKTACDNE